MRWLLRGPTKSRVLVDQRVRQPGAPVGDAVEQPGRRDQQTAAREEAVRHVGGQRSVRVRGVTTGHIIVS